MGAGAGGRYTPETCQERCFTHDLGKFVPELIKPKSGVFLVWVLSFRTIKVNYANS